MIVNPYRDELPEAIKQAFKAKDADEAACIDSMFSASFMMGKKDISKVMGEAGVSVSDWNALVAKYVPKTKGKKKTKEEKEEEEFEFEDESSEHLSTPRGDGGDEE